MVVKYTILKSIIHKLLQWNWILFFYSRSGVFLFCLFLLMFKWWTLIQNAGVSGVKNVASSFILTSNSTNKMDESGIMNIMYHLFFIFFLNWGLFGTICSKLFDIVGSTAWANSGSGVCAITSHLCNMATMK